MNPWQKVFNILEPEKQVWLENSIESREWHKIRLERYTEVGHGKLCAQQSAWQRGGLQ